MNSLLIAPFYLNGCGSVINEPETRNKIPGNRAIWVGIFAEMTEFAMFFIVYFIAKAHYPEQFSQGPLHLNTLAGTLNTIALITSSYFVAKALFAIRQGNKNQSIKWLWAAVSAGVLYLMIKIWEYYWNSSHGIHSDTNSFYTMYYYMTFNHLLHVGWASGSLLWAIKQLKSGYYTQENHVGLTAIASYWHMVDLAWIIIFPLLYVLR
ncbi:cytochrome c oxidase subunit 3 family protein [Pseudoalteromonas denitrificans]|uniref:Cytochrome c oxidase subunit 3 n=1 Tax=Pseudoalteromonas denitrificans DSM 6059 TaxID=1123010 RepID=A0A1I1P220_9GAMM|nr:cytochrome c oxidase subunit 3 family protein [Pseudoalteromonas denitrificans]SFD00010.1 cytochrome c oxidase subunit 3 [Pseudoalteromonas denitrificans DSM 6059]